jgi:hypothetical protein
MYVAEGNEVYYCHPSEGRSSRELFLTVHDTKDRSITVEEQTRVLADILNGLPASA